MKLINVDYFEEEEVYEKKVKLVAIPDDKKAWIVNYHDDWIHDCYDGSTIFCGMIYSPFESFFPYSTEITGYFHDDDSKKWIKVEYGKASLENNHHQPVWWENLEELIRFELTEQKK